jgi:cell division protein FtsA
MEELLELIKRQIVISGFDGRFGAGVVLTGGASQLNGFVELAEQILELPVRIGYPQRIYGLSDQVRDPKFATGVGLVLYGDKKQHGSSRSRGIYADNSDEHVFKNITKKMKGWIKDFF